MKKRRRINESDFKIILPVAEQGIIDRAAIKMSKQFGGVTMHPFIRGLWADDKGKLIKDDNVLLTSSRDLEHIINRRKTLAADRKFMKELAHEFGKRLKQDAIWIEEDIVRDIQFIKTKQKLKKLT